MNRLVFYTVAVLFGAVLATFDLVNGWTANPGALVFVAVVGLWLGALALLVLAFVAVLGERRRILASALDQGALIARAARGLRLSTVFAIGFSLLDFADCSSSVNSDGTLFGGPMADPAHFWPLAAWLVLPMLAVLTLPAVFMTISEISSAKRPLRSQAIADAATWSTVAIVVAAVATVLAPLFFAVPECVAQNSPGSCAAGAGGFMNGLSVGALALYLPYLLALYLPYLLMVRRALRAGHPR
jgi:hypothetical protein